MGKGYYEWDFDGFRSGRIGLTMIHIDFAKRGEFVKHHLVIYSSSTVAPWLPINPGKVQHLECVSDGSKSGSFWIRVASNSPGTVFGNLATKRWLSLIYSG